MLCGCHCLDTACDCRGLDAPFICNRLSAVFICLYGATFICMRAIATSKIYPINDNKSNQ